MKILMRYQLRYLRIYLIFGLVAFIILALLFKEDLVISTEKMAVYVLILSLLYNYYSFMTTDEFRRILFTLPFTAKDFIKTVFLSSTIVTSYLFLVAAIVAFITMQFYEITREPFIGLLILLPITSVIMGVKHYVLLRTNIKGDFASELLVYFGGGLLFGLAALLVFTLPNEYFWYSIVLLYTLCIAIKYYTYKLSCKHADRIYVIVRNEKSSNVHESIHREQLAGDRR